MIQNLNSFFNTSSIEKAIESAAQDMASYMKLPPIQTIALRLMQQNGQISHS